MEVGLEADVVCRVAAEFVCFLGVSGFNSEFTYWALLGDEEVWDFLWAELLGFWSIIYYVARAWAMLPSSDQIEIYQRSVELHACHNPLVMDKFRRLIGPYSFTQPSRVTTTQS